MKSFLLFLSFIIVIASAIVIGWWAIEQGSPETPSEDDQVVCTLDAMLCPDGSYVGRVPPSCEFAPCDGPGLESGPGPTPDSTDDWETYSDEVVSFRYPAEMGTDYVGPVEWPPRVSVSDELYECAYGEELNFGDFRFCKYAESEGAAGTTYTSYTYKVVTNGDDLGHEIVYIAFTIRYPQCLNYDEPAQSQCQDDQSFLELDRLINEIAQTISVK